MRSPHSFVVVALLSVATALVACGEDQPQVSPVVVMTQDLGTGADLDAVLAASAADVPARVDAMWAERSHSDFGARADAIAAGIGLFHPDLVGLQSVIQWRQQIPASPAPADELVSDHLEQLLTALAARGLAYDPVAATTTTDIELTGASGNDYRLTDRVVILAARGLKTRVALGGTFPSRRSISVAGSPIELVRGWASIAAEKSGKTFRLVNAHLDSEGTVQREQARQLVSLVDVDAPTLVVGNLGSDTSPAYGILLGGALSVDVPGRAGSGVPSCCRDVALVDPAAKLRRRDDFVLGTGHFTASWGSWALGNGTPMVSGLWPSSHAGIAAGAWLQ